VVTFVKKGVKGKSRCAEANEGFGDAKFNKGLVVMTDHTSFVLFNVQFPAPGSEVLSALSSSLPFCCLLSPPLCLLFCCLFHLILA
jgi:hypothetical protein